MNARDPQLPVQPDEASAIAEFASRVWDDEIVPAITDYIAIPAKSPMFDADWARHGHLGCRATVALCRQAQVAEIRHRRIRAAVRAFRGRRRSPAPPRR